MVVTLDLQERSIAENQGRVEATRASVGALLGNVDEAPLDKICLGFETLSQLRDADQPRGRCGRCEYRRACGGSRARSYAVGGELTVEDSLCSDDAAGP